MDDTLATWAIDRATMLRVVPKTRLKAAEIRDAGRVLTDFIDKAMTELAAKVPLEVTGENIADDERTLTEVAHVLAGHDRKDARRQVGLFTAADLRDDGFLAEHEVLRLDAALDEEVWSDEALAEWGLARLPEPDDGVPPLYSAGLEDHLRACAYYKNRRTA